LTAQMIKLFKADLGQPVKGLAKKFRVNLTSLSGYLKALENQGYVKSKKIGPPGIYLKGSGEKT